MSMDRTQGIWGWQFKAIYGGLAIFLMVMSPLVGNDPLALVAISPDPSFTDLSFLEFTPATLLRGCAGFCLGMVALPAFLRALDMGPRERTD